MPQAPADMSGTDVAAPNAVGTLALNTESCFSRLVLLHDGHSTVLPFLTSVSNRFVHSPHTYSNIGIPTSIQNKCTAVGAKSPIRTNATPTTPSPTALHSRNTTPVMIWAVASTIPSCSAAEDISYWW